METHLQVKKIKLNKTSNHSCEKYKFWVSYFEQTGKHKQLEFKRE